MHGVLNISGGMGKEAQNLVKRLAQRMEMSTGQRYADAVGFYQKETPI